MYLGTVTTGETLDVFAFNAACDAWSITANAGAGGYVAAPAGVDSAVQFRIPVTVNGTGDVEGTLPAGVHHWQIRVRAATVAGSTVRWTGEAVANAAGDGAYAYDIVVYEDDGETAIPGARVRLSAGATSYLATADENGVASFSVDAAAWTVSITAPGGWQYTPTVVNVAASGSTDAIMAPGATVAPSADPAKTNAHTTTRDGKGDPVAATITFRLRDEPDGSNDSYGREAIEVVSGDDGLVEQLLPINTAYQARRDLGPWVPFTTGSGGTYTLPPALGRPDGEP